MMRKAVIGLPQPRCGTGKAGVVKSIRQGDDALERRTVLFERHKAEFEGQITRSPKNLAVLATKDEIIESRQNNRSRLSLEPDGIFSY